MDDTSCAAYFTAEKDANNVSLSGDLESLANNGGFVPTVALKSSSLAVDGGLAVMGLATDARGSNRLMGTAVDVGAYESSFSSSSVQTLPVVGSAFRVLVMLVAVATAVFAAKLHSKNTA